MPMEAGATVAGGEATAEQLPYSSSRCRWRLELLRPEQGQLQSSCPTVAVDADGGWSYRRRAAAEGQGQATWNDTGRGMFSA
jgi:hypothetical protein